MFFFSFNNVNIDFLEAERLTWTFYIIAEALPTTNWIELINKYKFAKGVLYKIFETFIVYVVALEASEETGMIIDLSRIAPANPAQVAAVE